MKFLPAFVIILFFPFLMSAQFEMEPNTFRVIAMDGLNIRSGPGKNSKIIGGIPFLGLVKVLNTQEEWRRDTLGENTFYHQNETYRIPIIGHWVKITYHNIKGFVFSPYLAPIGPNQEHEIKDVNQQFGLNFPGQTCSDNVYRNKELFWYGLYRNSDGTYSWEEIDIDYNTLDSGIGWMDVNVTGGKKGLLLMYGQSERKDIQGSINGIFYALFDQEPSFIDYDTHQAKQPANGLKTELDPQEGRWLIKHNRQGNTQVLNPLHYRLSSPGSLVWRGDIDGDGWKDYIIRYGDKSVQVILYLSSEARAGELLRPVAVFYTGYCC